MARKGQPEFSVPKGFFLPSEDQRGFSQGLYIPVTYPEAADFQNTYQRDLEQGLITSGQENHNVLSATHSDTLAGTVVKGDFMIGNATPKWDRLAIGTTIYVPVLYDPTATNNLAWADQYWFPNPQRKEMWTQRVAQGSGLASAGETNSVATAGALTTVSDSTGSYTNYQSAAGVSNGAGVSMFGAGGLSQARLERRPVFTVVIKTGANASDITNVRIWCGLGGGAAGGGIGGVIGDFDDDAPDHNVMAFRFSTGASDTKWQCVTNDGDATGHTITDSGVTVASDTRYVFQVDCRNTASIKFWLNGSLVATHTTQLPLADSDINFMARLWNLDAGVQHNLRFSKWHMSWD